MNSFYEVNTTGGLIWSHPSVYLCNFNWFKCVPTLKNTSTTSLLYFNAKGSQLVPTAREQKTIGGEMFWCRPARRSGVQQEKQTFLLSPTLSSCLRSFNCFDLQEWLKMTEASFVAELFVLFLTPNKKVWGLNPLCGVFRSSLCLQGSLWAPASSYSPKTRVTFVSQTNPDSRFIHKLWQNKPKQEGKLQKK